MSSSDHEVTLSYEEEIAQVLLDISNIKGQIDAAKARAREYGEYTDSVWLAKASSALRYKQARHQELMRLAGAERRKQKREVSNSLGHAFIDAAKHLLDQETFQEIMDEAHNYMRIRGSHE